MFWLPVLSQVGILSLLDTLGAFFGPIFGLIIADYYLIKKKILLIKIFFHQIKKVLIYIQMVGTLKRFTQF